MSPRIQAERPIIWAETGLVIRKNRAITRIRQVMGSQPFRSMQARRMEKTEVVLHFAAA
jgi:hypothetical protein